MNSPNIAIIGGGAAGFFAAITAKQKHPEAAITIFEKQQKVLAKVMLTGGGRCNLTNSFAHISDLKQAYPRGHQLMKRLFRQFDYRQTYQWFTDRGVALVTQDDQCVFPQSQDARSIVNCLVHEAHRLGVNISTDHQLTQSRQQNDGRWLLTFRNGKPQSFHRVAITTGGAPHPRHLLHLDGLGHVIEPPVPSLFTFNIPDPQFLHLMGTVVNPVIASIPATKFRAEGPLLITHWGMSGPAILKLSSHAARYLHEQQYNAPLAINWVGRSNQSEIEETLLALASTNPQKQLATRSPFGLPSRLWLYILQKTGLSGDRKWAELGRKSIHRLVEMLANDRYQIAGKGTFKEEFVTCGGIALGNIHPHTLESKVCPHLFFAGEVLDIDAITGGFNLQAAWTTGYVVGQHIAE